MIRQLTVSELIRESKPDWEHVRTRDVLPATRKFSGALQVHLTAPDTFEKQVADFESGTNDAFFDEKDRIVENTLNPTSNAGSQVPR